MEIGEWREIFYSAAPMLRDDCLNFFEVIPMKLREKNEDVCKEWINYGMTLEHEFQVEVTFMGKLQRVMPMKLIHLASFSGCTGIVKYLIERKGCSCQEKTSDDFTLVHSAASGGHLKTVQYLIEEKGAFPEKRDKYNCSPLDSAAFFGQLRIVRYLALYYPQILPCDLGYFLFNELT